MSKTNGQRQLAVCGCGCGAEAHWNRLHLLKGVDGRSYHVLDGCRGAFEEELKAFVIIKDLTAKLRHQLFWRRWAYARSWFSCQYILRARLRGADAAARDARRDTMLFVLPVWLGVVASRWSARKGGG